MIRSRSLPALLLLSTLALLALPATSARALTTHEHSFDITFTLTDIQIDGTGTTIDPFFLDDIFIELQQLPGSIGFNETGTGSIDQNDITNFVNGSELGPLDDAVLELDDTFRTLQEQMTSADAPSGIGLIFQPFAWELGIENQTFEDLLFFFDWEYTRASTQVDMGGDNVAFLSAGVASTEDDLGDPQSSEDIFPEFNVGTPLNDFQSGSFSILSAGTTGQFTSLTIDWELGTLSEVEASVPEPSAMVLVMAGLAAALRRRA